MRAPRTFFFNEYSLVNDDLFLASTAVSVQTEKVIVTHQVDEKYCERINWKSWKQGNSAESKRCETGLRKFQTNAITETSVDCVFKFDNQKILQCCQKFGET